MELVEFLLARIAEDEAVARDAAGRPGGGSWGAGRDKVHVVGQPEVWNGTTVGSGQDWAQATHIARWDPARVLAECAAKRAIVEYFERKRPEFWGEIRMAQLRALALPYADHPDYDPAWNPEATQ